MKVKKSQKKEKAGMISDEEIQKAFDQLQSVADDFSKANDEDEGFDEEEVEEEEDFEEEETDEEEEEEDVEKGNDDEMEEDDEEEDEDEDEEEEEAPAPKKKVKKACKKTIKKSNAGQAMTSHSQPVKEGVEVSEFLKGLVTDFDSTIQNQNRVLGNMAIVMKGMVNEINDLKASLGEPRQRKSKLSAKDVQDRFSKGNGDEMEDGGSKVISKKTGRKEIVKALDALTFNERGINMEYANALTLFEASGELSPSIQKAVEDQLGAKIQ